MSESGNQVAATLIQSVVSCNDIDQRFEQLSSLVFRVNRLIESGVRLEFRDLEYYQNFIDNFTKLMMHSFDILKAKNYLELWFFCRKSGIKELLLWTNAHRHLVERAIVSEKLNDYEDIGIRNAILSEHFGIETVDVAPIFLCGMPRSGSTSLSHLLSMYFRRVISSGHNVNAIDHGLNMLHLGPLIKQGSVIHSHLRPSLDVSSLFKVLGIRPIVTVRNIFDAIHSLHFHDKTDHNNFIFRDKDFLNRRDFHLTVHKFSYYYISFVHQWAEAAKIAPVKILHFEDNVNNWESALRACVLHLGVEYDVKWGKEVLRTYEERVINTPESFRVSNRSTRTNEFNYKDIEIIQDILKYFPKENFERVLKPWPVV